MTDLLDEILLDEIPDASAFALLCRAGGSLEVLVGDPVPVRDLADLPVHGPDLVAVLPYRQIAERGLPCVDDGTPVLAFGVRARSRLPVGEALRRLPSGPADVEEGEFDVSDAEYEAIVRRGGAGDIGGGSGSNF